ncbi:hypothetical protein J6590_062369 [Homalodisca vitripennis]|nr:hypothetical protein J6590_062369 [Homalodisca vitripennis]
MSESFVRTRKRSKLKKRKIASEGRLVSRDNACGGRVGSTEGQPALTFALIDGSQRWYIILNIVAVCVPARGARHLTLAYISRDKGR